MPCFGNDFTQAHWKRCACVRIRAIIRTDLSISGEKRDEFCLTIIFYRLFVAVPFLEVLCAPLLMNMAVNTVLTLYPCNYYSDAL